jgi:DNA-binding response OmpR family regulator
MIVEDEPDVARPLRAGLEGGGYDVEVATSGESAFFRMSTEPFQLILLDLTLPDRDGVSLLRAMRARGLNTPVLVVTARDALQDRIIGLNAGADDYLVKPFALEEVLARVRALLRRPPTAQPVRLSVLDLEMDLLGRRVSRAGVPIDLTAREFQLLEYLMRHEGSVVSRGMLVRDVWKYSTASTTVDNLIDVHVARLRRKIDAHHAQKLIHTIRRIGFAVREERV